MAKFNAGDAVIVAGREQTAADVKSGLFYNHYAGLTGTILKLYGEEASIRVDKEALAPEIVKRHTDNEKAMRQRWLDGLSEEARSKLSATEKAFGLHYSILVSLADLTPNKNAVKRPTATDLDSAEAKFLAERATAKA